MFYLVQAGSTLQAVKADGTAVTTLTLPDDVTIDATVRGQFHILAGQILFTRAPSVNLWIDPVTFTVRVMTIPAPASGPTLTASGTAGLVGAYRAAYTYAVLNEEGAIINESGLSPFSNQVTVADQGIDWTDISASPTSGVNARVLYRTLVNGDGSTFYQRNIIANNLTTTFGTDTLDDSGLGLLPLWMGNNEPPGGVIPGTSLSLCIAWKERLWAVSAAHPDILRWSEPGQFWAWPDDNELLLTVQGEDEHGATGFLPRRDDLVIGKRKRVLRCIGGESVTTDGAASFEIKGEYAGYAVLAPFSCLVIDNVGYFLGFDGAYSVDAEGVTSISDGKVDQWFRTDTVFNRGEFPNALARYNLDTQTYELFLARAGETAIYTWVSYHIPTGQWFGPHTSALITAISAVDTVQDGDARPEPILAGQDSYLYWQQPGVQGIDVANSDVPGGGGSRVAVASDVIGAVLSPGDPDLFRYFGRPTVFMRPEGTTAAGRTQMDFHVGGITTAIDDFVGPTAYVEAAQDRTVLPRLGTGRIVKFRLRHSQIDEGMQVQALKIPARDIGRR